MRSRSMISIDDFAGTKGSRQPAIGVNGQPRPGCAWHVGEHPSPDVVLLSSHSSLQFSWTVPSPQIIELPTQWPPVHLSGTVQAMPSSHAVPSGSKAFAGHWGPLPEQTSAGSHATSSDGLHSVPA